MRRYFGKTQPLLIFLVILSLSCGKDSKSPTGSSDNKYSLTGKILENDSGLSGVSVNIKGSDIDKTVTTDSNGSYSLGDLPNGTYTVTPSLSGYTFSPLGTNITISSSNITAETITASKTGNGGELHEYKNITYVTIPGGTFEMGSDFEDDPNNPYRGVGYYEDERPIHSVTVSGFEMSIYEVTTAQYAAYLTEALTSGDITASGSKVVGASGAWSGEKYLFVDSDYCYISYSSGTFSVKSGKENHPLQGVSWYGSKAFAEYYGFDLPTEAEWEYACRARSETYFYTGNNLSRDGETSTDFNNAGWYLEDHPVGQKEPNGWGLYDMHGNAMEWCNDWYGDSYYSTSPSNNPTGPSSGTYRVIRGGGWHIGAMDCRSANRYMLWPTHTMYNGGFRIVRRP